MNYCFNVLQFRKTIFFQVKIPHITGSHDFPCSKVPDIYSRIVFSFSGQLLLMFDIINHDEYFVTISETRNPYISFYDALDYHHSFH